MGGPHVEEMDEFVFSSVDARIEDLHQTFADAAVGCLASPGAGCVTGQVLHVNGGGAFGRQAAILPTGYAARAADLPHQMRGDGGKLGFLPSICM